MMRFRFRILTVLAAFWLLAAAAGPALAETLFVFDEAGTATAFETAEFERIGSRSIGVVGRAAHEVAFEGGRRFFIVGPREIVVLDQDLAVLRRLPLEGVSPSGAPSALDPASGLLAVAAGHAVYLIDTTDAVVTQRIEAEGEIAGVALAAEGGAVNVLFAESGTVRALDLATASWRPGVFELPDNTPTLVGGGAVGAGRGVYDLTGLRPQFFGQARPGALQPVDDVDTVHPLAALPSGATLTRAGGFARLHTASGAQPLLRDGAGTPVPLASIADAAFVADGGLVVAVSDTNTLVRLDANARSLGDITLAIAPAALAIAPEPVTQGLLLKVSGDVIVAENGAFQLIVSGPTGGAPMTVTAVPDVVDCSPVPPLSGQTAIDCTAGAVTQTVVSNVTVDAGPNIGSVGFQVTVLNSGGSDGLSIVSGDNQEVFEGEDFDLVVELRQGGLPAGGETLEVDELPNSALSCPSTVSTAVTGLATITCTAEDADEETPAVVQVTFDTDPDPLEVEFSLIIKPGADPQEGLTKITDDPLNIVESTSFNLIVDAETGGNPDVGLELDITESGSSVSCPSNVETTFQGRATVTCTANTVSQNRTVIVTFSDGARSVAFTVNVIDSSNASGVQIVSGDDQVVPLGAELQPLVVSSFLNGVPRSDIQLNITVDQDEFFLFCPSSWRTDSSGIASFVCTAGSNATSIETVRVNVTDSGTGADLDESFTITILPTEGTTAAGLERLSSSTITGRVGQTLQDAIEVRAVDDMGNSVGGALVFFRSDDPEVTFDPAVATTTTSGIAQTNVIFGCPGPTGEIEVGVSTEETNLTISYGVGVGTLSSLTITQGDGQSGTPGVTLPTALVVRSEDVCGNVLPRRPVTWTVNPSNAATLLNTGSQTNSAGIASTRVQLGSFGGPFTVTATSGAVQAVFNLTVNSVPTNLLGVSGGGQNVPAGAQAAAPVVVRVTNEQGQGVNGIQVQFNVIAGQATVQPGSTQTDGDGQASAIVTAGEALGEIIIEASAINRTVRFSLFVVGQTPVISVEGIVNGASFRVGLTPGGTASIFGSRLMEGVNGAVLTPFNNGFPLEFRGVSVAINGLSAPILGLADIGGQQQINIQAPFGLATGPAVVVVTNNGSSTTITGVQVLAEQPGIFEVFVQGGRFAAALHSDDFSLVTPSNPARPNEIILLFLTGLGALNPAVATNVPGPASPLAQPRGEIVVGINNAGVQNLGAFYAPGLITVYQVNFRTGGSLPNGTVNVSVVYNGVGSQTVLLPTASQ